VDDEVVQQALQLEEVKLFVGRVPQSYSDTDLRPIFSVFGEVTECFIFREKTTGRSKGAGFIKFLLLHEANTCIEALHNKRFLGNSETPLQISYADGEMQRLNSIWHQQQQQQQRRVTQQQHQVNQGCWAEAQAEEGAGGWDQAAEMPPSPEDFPSPGWGMATTPRSIADNITTRTGEKHKQRNDGHHHGHHRARTIQPGSSSINQYKRERVRDAEFILGK
jgi:hypothetical protein